MFGKPVALVPQGIGQTRQVERALQGLRRRGIGGYRCKVEY